MTADDKTAPRGALEEAVALFDKAFHLAHDMASEWDTPNGNRYADKLEDLRRRRAALEPRLAKRRENQAKG